VGIPVATPRAWRGLSVLALVGLFALLLSPIVARADNVQDDVVAGGNDTFTAGGSTVVNYRIAANSGDGQAGCNASEGTAATVSINVPAGVTANPSSLTFTSCGTNKPVTFSSSTPGNYPTSVSVSDAGVGTYNTSPASFTLHVLAPADTTAPVITPNVAGTLGNNPWYVSDVTVSWNVVDNESAITSSSGCGSTTISADTAGTTLTCSATSAGGMASNSVTIKRDATAPTISGSAAPAPNGNGWNNGPVAASFTCGDNLSGIAACGPDNSLSSNGAGQSITGTATDAAGNTASLTLSGINIDQSNPTITAHVSAAANGNGWRNTDVTVSFDCADDVSGIAACSPVVVLGEGADQSATGTATDLAGNSSSVTVTNIDVDETNPIISGSRNPAANADGWNNGPVAVSFVCTDALSDIDTCAGNTTLSAEGAAQSVTGTATDNAGNTKTATVGNINIDLTKPTNVQFTGNALSNGGQYYFGSVPSGPSGCTADDALSGINSCAIDSGYSTAVGSHTVTATATDKAGNTETKSISYTVLGWNVTGFYAPVTMDGTRVNTVKGGSTVPLKFEVFAGPAGQNEQTSLSAVTGFAAVKVSCDSGDVLDPVDFITTGNTSLRYDTAAGQFIQNWKTPTATGCYRVALTTADGSILSADFKVTK
jgi:hypothetical protein